MTYTQRLIPLLGPKRVNRYLVPLNPRPSCVTIGKCNPKHLPYIMELCYLLFLLTLSSLNLDFNHSYLELTI